MSPEDLGTYIALKSNSRPSLAQVIAPARLISSPVTIEKAKDV